MHSLLNQNTTSDNGKKQMTLVTGILLEGITLSEILENLWDNLIKSSLSRRDTNDQREWLIESVNE